MRVHLGGCWHTVESALHQPPSSWGDQERNALDVIRQWLSGKSEFTFQTSGSTGSPKSLTFRREQLEASAKLTADALGLKRGTTSLVCLDVNFVAGTMMIIRSLVTGMDMVIQPASANPLSGLQETIDFIALVPLQLATVLRESPNELNRISIVLIGGASLSMQSIEQLQDRPNAYFATYGMTETLTHIALQRLNGPHVQDTFRLLPGIDASTDERGCLVVQAPHLGSTPIATNDHVEFTSPTNFRVIGRTDAVVNSGGIKIHPKKIEDVVHRVLMALGIQVRFFITGKPDEQLGERVCLVLEGQPQSSAVEVAIKDGLGKQLGKFEVPKEIQYAQLFSETPTQKIDRLATLRKLANEK